VAKVKLLDPTDQRRKLDRYELIGEIATGGMATVFLARLGGVGGFQRFVAIKRLHPHLGSEPEFVEMFLDEARLAALIHHPNVVPILEVGTSDSGYYLVMEYVEGDTLARLVSRSMAGGQLPQRAALLRILLDSLHGLHAAHELADERNQLLGLVHRDVSPQNILVGVDGTARITDFGVARATSRLSFTSDGKLKGKLAYMSPEQARGDELDRRSDVFAMGVVIWEVLVGRRLFKAETEAGTLQRILVEPVRKPSDMLSTIPRVYDDVVLRALDRDARTRFQTAADLADALEKVARDTDGIASPREVASFVQQLLGQEIGAQRESVRAWLAQSDTSHPSITPSRLDRLGEGRTSTPAPPAPPSSRRGEAMPMRDVTVRVPLDKAAEVVELGNRLSAGHPHPGQGGHAQRPSPPLTAPQSSPTLIGHGAPPPSLEDNDFESEKTHTRPSEPRRDAPIQPWNGSDGAVTHAMATVSASGAPPPDLDDLPTRANPVRSEMPSGSSVTPGGVSLPPGPYTGHLERDPLLDDDPFPREKKGKRWLVLLAAALLVFCGGLLWIRMSPEQVTSTPTVTVGAKPPPTTEPKATAEPKTQPSTEPTAEASADTPDSAAPEASAAPAPAAPRPQGPRGPRPPKTAEPPKQPDPPKKPDEDLTSPYK
jgi:serine/threonine protein kinase